MTFFRSTANWSWRAWARGGKPPA